MSRVIIRQRLMRVGEVARTLGISTSTVYKWTDEYRLPRPIIIGKIRHWDRRTIMRLAGK